MSKLETLKESKSEEEKNQSTTEIDLTGDGGVIKRIVAPGM